MDLEDAQLVYRSLSGDTSAYGKLVERYSGAVYAVAFYYAGRFGSAEDVAQEAFLAAYRDLKRLDEPSKFAPWLREITARTAANWLRKHGKRLESETPLPFRRTVSIEDARQNPMGVFERRERYERVQKAIDALPEKYRLPVILRYLQELSYAEIAEFMGISREEVRGCLQRAGRQLRDILIDMTEQSEGEGEWRPARK